MSLIKKSLTNMTGVLMKRGHLNTGVHTGRTSSRDEGRGHDDACRKGRDGQQASKPAIRLPAEARRRLGTDDPSKPSERNHAC